MTSARASATRCCWPPENSRGLRSASASRRTIAKASLTRTAISACGTFAHLQTERDVLRDSHMRKQRVALEHKTHVAPVGRHAGDVFAADDDPSGTRRDQTGNHPQESWSCRSLKARGEPRARPSAPPRSRDATASDVAVAFGQAVETEVRVAVRRQRRQPPRDSCAASSRTPCSPGAAQVLLDRVPAAKRRRRNAQERPSG